MWVRRLASPDPGDDGEGVESLNISIRGAYFATGAKFCEGEKISVRLWMPEQIAAGQRTEWCFTGLITHVERLGANGKIGVGVHFLYYTAAEKLPVELMSAPRPERLLRGFDRFPHVTRQASK